MDQNPTANLPADMDLTAQATKQFARNQDQGVLPSTHLSRESHMHLLLFYAA